MAKLKKSHGGKRGRSGRKPVDDKKTGVTIWIQESKIETLGGKESVQSLMTDALQTALSTELQTA